MTPQNVILRSTITSTNITIGHRTAEKIRSFTELTNGWHYGNGSAPGAAIVREALRLHAMVVGDGFRDTEAFPGIDGEVLLTAYHGPHYLEILIEVDGTVTFTHEIEDVIARRMHNLSEVECREWVKKTAEEIWKSSASYTFDISMLKSDDLRAWRSRIRPKVAVSRSLNANAYSGQVLEFAVTLRNTMERSPAIPPSFGLSIQKHSLQMPS